MHLLFLIRAGNITEVGNFSTVEAACEMGQLRAKNDTGLGGFYEVEDLDGYRHGCFPCLTA